MKLISTLQDGDWVRSIYLCRQKMEAKTKVGKDYYSLTLQDRSGSIIASMTAPRALMMIPATRSPFR